MMSAAAGHDDGWTYNDELPALNSDGRPADLFADGAGKSLRIHKDTADMGRKRSSYAALLISMHRTGLMQNRYGIERGADSGVIDKTKSSLNRDVQEWVVEEERWQKDVCAERGMPFADSVHLWSNYKLLQVWDRMSLYLCYLDRNKATSATFFPVPAKYGKSDLKIRINAVRNGSIRVKPWPFRVKSFRASVRMRVIRDVEYGSSLDVAEELLAATPRVATFHLAGI